MTRDEMVDLYVERRRFSLQSQHRVVSAALAVALNPSDATRSALKLADDTLDAALVAEAQTWCDLVDGIASCANGVPPSKPNRYAVNLAAFARSSSTSPRTTPRTTSSL